MGVVGGILAGDGVIGADRVEAPRRQRAAGARRIASAGGCGNGRRVLTVDELLLSRGVDKSEHADDDDDDEDSDCGAKTDGQSYRQRRVAAG